MEGDSTAQKMKFSIKDFGANQIRMKLRIWSHLMKKSLIENFIIFAVKWALTQRLSWKQNSTNIPQENLLEIDVGNLHHFSKCPSKNKIYNIFNTAPNFAIVHPISTEQLFCQLRLHYLENFKFVGKSTPHNLKAPILQNSFQWLLLCVSVHKNAVLS